MSELKPCPKDAPVMIAWEAYKASDDYANTRRWALHNEHVDGSLWAAFFAGFDRAAIPSLQTEPEEVTEAMEDAGCEAFHEAVAKAKAERKARNDAYEVAGRGRLCSETAMFPVDWLAPVYLAMRSAALRGTNGA